MPSQPSSLIKGALKRLLGDRNYHFARAFYHNYPILCMRHKPVLFVHTMGKVGSSTVISFLRRVGLEEEYSILRTSFLSKQGVSFLEEIEEAGYGGWERYPPNIKSMLADGYVNGRILSKLERLNFMPSVITLVRDPVATNISSFFQNFKWFPPDLLRKCERNEGDYLQQLYRRFLNTYAHDLPLAWVEREIEWVFGVDVYGTAFATDQGYEIYYGDFTKVLIVRLENLDVCIQPALREFLGVEMVELINRNIAAEKWYGSIYKEFLETIRMPEEYLNKMYDSRYARHFYTQEEIATFKERWAKSILWLN